MKTVFYSRAAAKALAAIARPQQQRIRDKIDQLAADPASLANNVKMLQGVDAKRLRVGDYRVIFTESLEILDILKVGHRREIYD